MLDVSQIDVDAMALNLTEVRLDSVLRIAIEPLVEAIRQRRLVLNVQGFRDLPVISGDFQRLVQVVGNLASNAVKYTPDGGRITISARKIEDQEANVTEVELIFADTGVGVDPRDHELIFDKFFRTYDPKLHSTGSTKFQGAGPGLGLSIVRGIVKAHGGRIWLRVGRTRSGELSWQRIPYHPAHQGARTGRDLSGERQSRQGRAPPLHKLGGAPELVAGYQVLECCQAGVLDLHPRRSRTFPRLDPAHSGCRTPGSPAGKAG